MKYGCFDLPVHELLTCAAHLNALIVGSYIFEDSTVCWTVLPTTSEQTVTLHSRDIPTHLCSSVLSWLPTDVDAILNQILTNTGATSRRIRLAYQFTPEICKELAELSTNVMTGDTSVPQMEMEHALTYFAAELQAVIDTANPEGLVISTEYEIPIPYAQQSNNLSLSIQ